MRPLAVAERCRGAEEVESEKALKEVRPGAERRKNRRRTQGQKQGKEEDRVPVTKERAGKIG